MKRAAILVAVGAAAFYAGLVFGVRRTLQLAPHEFLAYKARLQGKEAVRGPEHR